MRQRNPSEHTCLTSARHNLRLDHAWSCRIGKAVGTAPFGCSDQAGHGKLHQLQVQRWGNRMNLSSGEGRPRRASGRAPHIGCRLERFREAAYRASKALLNILKCLPGAPRRHGQPPCALMRLPPTAWQYPRDRKHRPLRAPSCARHTPQTYGAMR